MPGHPSELRYGELWYEYLSVDLWRTCYSIFIRKMVSVRIITKFCLSAYEGSFLEYLFRNVK